MDDEYIIMITTRRMSANQIQEFILELINDPRTVDVERARLDSSDNEYKTPSEQAP